MLCEVSCNILYLTGSQQPENAYWQSPKEACVSLMSHEKSLGKVCDLLHLTLFYVNNV